MYSYAVPRRPLEHLSNKSGEENQVSFVFLTVCSVCCISESAECAIQSSHFKLVLYAVTQTEAHCQPSVSDTVNRHQGHDQWASTECQWTCLWGCNSDFQHNEERSF